MDMQRAGTGAVRELSSLERTLLQRPVEWCISVRSSTGGVARTGVTGDMVSGELRPFRRMPAVASPPADATAKELNSAGIQKPSRNSNP